MSAQSDLENEDAERYKRSPVYFIYFRLIGLDERFSQLAAVALGLRRCGHPPT